MEVTLITTSNSSRRTSSMVKVKSHGISILFDLMQRLCSSCVRSRSLIYASPRSFLCSARFKFSNPSKVLSRELNNKAIDTAAHASGSSGELDNNATDTAERASSPIKVLSRELNNKAIDVAERASSTQDRSPDDTWVGISNRAMEDLMTPSNAYSG
jgi:hypothetical protein